VRSYKIQKIDLSSEYPCPCRRKGNLKPIVLTEALGCDRCQQIFVVKKDGQVIEQLSSIYQKKSWQWTGNRWKNAYARWTQSYWSTMAILTFCSAIFVMVILPMLLRWMSTQSIISWAVLFLILTMLLILTLFVVYRH
jgi:cellulose synthase/poly-beta-1,6-N-acetylglucosamine synthase-like glycosyltransferase